MGVFASSLMIFALAYSAQAVSFKAGEFDVDIYASLRLFAAYDTQRCNSDDAAMWALPKVAGDNDNQYTMTARRSRLGLKVAAPSTELFDVSGRAEIDFASGSSGTSPNPRLRLAYGTLAMKNGFSVLAGQAAETFQAPGPMMVNNSAGNNQGHLGTRRAQLRVRQDVKFGKATLGMALAAARQDGSDEDGGGAEDGQDAGIPAVQARIELKAPIFTEKPALFMLGGAYGQEKLDQVDEDKKIIKNDDKTYDSKLVLVGMSLPLCKMFSVVGEAWTGENLATYQGGIGQRINTTLDKAISASGGSLQLQAHLTQALTMSMAYGLDEPDSGDLNKGNRSKNSTMWANAFYQLTPNVQVAVEYMHIATDYKEGDEVKDNRFIFNTCFNF
ncbi:MAG: porin [Kiritimatiellae bacterium]|nr:porin [Kiritimatiellia bacterium]